MESSKLFWKIERKELVKLIEQSELIEEGKDYLVLKVGNRRIYIQFI